MVWRLKQSSIVLICLGGSCSQLPTAADEIIHFHYTVREFLEGLDARWPDSRPRDKSMDVAETAAKSRACLEAARQQKLLSNIGEP